MKVKANIGLLRKAGIGKNRSGDELFGEHHDDNNVIYIELRELTQKHIDKLEAIIGGMEPTEKQKWSYITQQINCQKEIAKNPKGAVINSSLDQLEEALIAYINVAPHKLLFEESADGTRLPYYVSHIKYHESKRVGEWYEPAHTDMVLEYVWRGTGQKKTISWHSSNVRGKHYVKDLLIKLGYFIESEDIYTEYVASMNLFYKVVAQIGEQYVMKDNGLAKSSPDRWSGYSFTALQTDGFKHKLVVDEEEKATEAKMVSSSFWGKTKDDSVSLPYHPYVQFYNLEKYQTTYAHVNNITPYIYDDKVVDKLVLPEEMKDLVDLLVTSAHNLLDDIIVGKTGGVIIVATGEPGTGKTLTAEVYAETIKRPLYKVQASQLGVDVKALETELKFVLGKAIKWRAILLIDEADVYIRARGNDINQNAIVGTFLRVLEYYAGVLFMTSNMATSIDDAILSRSTVHLKYKLPTTEEAKSIWKILADQFKCDLGPTIIDAAAQKFTNFSGRDIKGTLKLARLMSIRKSLPINMQLLEKVNKYQHKTSDSLITIPVVKN